MLMPTDYVTNERVENILLGIAQQIGGAMTTVKSEMTGLITEAELRWQTQLSELAEKAEVDHRGIHKMDAPPIERDREPAPPGCLEAVRAQLAESETRTSELLRAQNTELAQLQQVQKSWNTKPDVPLRRLLNYLSKGQTSCSTR